MLINKNKWLVQTAKVKYLSWENRNSVSFENPSKKTEV